MTLFKTTPAAIASRCAIALGLMLLTVTVVCAQPVNATDNNCQQQDNNKGGCLGIYPPDSEPFGRSYGEWSAKWWQWVYSIPLEKNPQLPGVVPPGHVPAPVTVDCSVGQSEPVWFLGANFTGVAVRECKDPVPSDVSIFFPVDNTYFGVIGFDCIQKGSFARVTYPFLPVNHCDWNPWKFVDGSNKIFVANWAGLVDLVSGWLDKPGPIEADVDRVPVRDLMTYRAKAPVFSVTTPSRNVLGYAWPGIPGQPGLGTFGTGVADTYYPNGSDGYWLMLKPLTPGRHTVHFSAGSNPIWLDVTYVFTVALDQGH
jgi:hypothetical protein